MRRQLLARVQQYPALNPAASLSAGAQNGVVIDRMAAIPTQPTGITAYTAYTSSAGIYDSANVMLALGAISGSPTATSVTIKVQHGDASDGSDMVDVPTTAYIDSTPTLTTANTNGNFDIDLAGLKRYIRVVATVAFTGGTSPAVYTASSIVFGDGKNQPAN